MSDNLRRVKPGMSKKQIQELLLDLLAGDNDIADLEITGRVELQDRPCTGIGLFITEYGAMRLKEYEGVGFSKVQWPDEWSEADGILLAEEKAISKIARQMYNDLQRSLVIEVQSE